MGWYRWSRGGVLSPELCHLTVQEVPKAVGHVVVAKLFHEDFHMPSGVSAVAVQGAYGHTDRVHKVLHCVL